MDIASRLTQALDRLPRAQGAWLPASILGGMVGEDISHDQILEAARSLCKAGLLEERGSGEDEHGEYFDLDPQEYLEAKAEGSYICPTAGEPRPLSGLAPYFAFPG